MLHVLDHALKYMHMLNHGILNNSSLYCSSIQVLIDFINSVIAIHVIFIRNFVFYFRLGLLHEFSVWKLSSSCLLNRLSASGYLMISATWWINFPIVLFFYMSLSSVCLLSVRQLTVLLAEMFVSGSFS